LVKNRHFCSASEHYVINENNRLNAPRDVASYPAGRILCGGRLVDVLEVVLSLPFLPVVKHATVLLSENITTALADRYGCDYWRCVCDACDGREKRHGADLIIQSPRKVSEGSSKHCKITMDFLIINCSRTKAFTFPM
jgi:hypothetical protein